MALNLNPSYRITCIYQYHWTFLYEVIWLENLTFSQNLVTFDLSPVLFHENNPSNQNVTTTEQLKPKLWLENFIWPKLSDL